MSKVKPIPDGYHTATPYIVVDGAVRAIEFYKKAFGAEELFTMPGPDGKVMHGEFRIGTSPIMISDENPEMGARGPKALGGCPASILLYVENVDKVTEQAVKAGAKALMPVTDMFWGDRYCKVEDPFGHQWQIATHKEDVSPEEMGKRAAAMMGG